MSQNFDPEKPFNQLPLLPPALELESVPVLKACIEAHRELARLKMAEKLIPNQKVLINSIPLLESQASSAIENIVTTTDELFEHAADPSFEMSSATKETLRYRQALYKGCEAIRSRPLTMATVCEICATIRQIETGIRKLPGTTLINPVSKEKIYTPPEGEELLRQLLSNWQQYLHESSRVDPLIKLAVQHYQFEAIHPFFDGNGRTGRIINLLYLIEQGLLETPILYLSGYIIDHKAQYYSHLLQITRSGQWEEWLLYFLRAIRQTARWTVDKILSIEQLMAQSRTLIKEKMGSSYSQELVEILFIQPYVRIANFVERGLFERQTASKQLKKLCEMGFLEEVKRGREKVFINRPFLELLKAK